MMAELEAREELRDLNLSPASTRMNIDPWSTKGKEEERFLIPSWLRDNWRNTEEKDGIVT